MQSAKTTERTSVLSASFQNCPKFREFSLSKLFSRKNDKGEVTALGRLWPRARSRFAILERSAPAHGERTANAE